MIKQVVKKIKFFKNSIKYAREIVVKVGSNTKLSTHEFGSEPFLITIGNNCHITKGVRFITHDGGVWVFRKEYPDMDVFGKIIIGDNVYIGNNATLMPGITIGDNVVVGANALVTKSIPSNVVVAGVPAKIISTLFEYKSKMVELNFKTKGTSNEERKKLILNKINYLGLQKKSL